MKRNSFDLSPAQIVELWLDLEVQGFDWRKIGPDDLASGSSEFREKLERAVWACRVVDDAFSRLMPAKANVGVVKGLIVHVVHHGKPIESFWLYDIGARRLEAIVDRFWRSVDAAAKAMPRHLEFEAA